MSEVRKCALPSLFALRTLRCRKNALGARLPNTIMPLRKVLILTYHFPPSGAVAVYRMLGLVRYLPKYGWQPIVVAPPRVPWEPEDVSLLAQIPAETPVERVPFASGFLGKIARSLAPESHWLWSASTACQRMIREHRPSAILTTSPPGC